MVSECGLHYLGMSQGKSHCVGCFKHLKMTRWIPQAPFKTELLGTCKYPCEYQDRGFAKEADVAPLCFGHGYPCKSLSLLLSLKGQKSFKYNPNPHLGFLIQWNFMILSNVYVNLKHTIFQVLYFHQSKNQILSWKFPEKNYPYSFLQRKTAI